MSGENTYSMIFSSFANLSHNPIPSNASLSAVAARAGTAAPNGVRAAGRVTATATAVCDGAKPTAAGVRGSFHTLTTGLFLSSHPFARQYARQSSIVPMTMPMRRDISVSYGTLLYQSGAEGAAFHRGYQS